MENRLAIEEICSVDEIGADVYSAWNQLVERQPMRSPTWLLSWWKHFGGDARELRVLLLRDAKELVGVAPLYVDVVGSKQVLRLLGDAGDVCTDHTTWFSKAGCEELVGNCVGKYFADNNGWNRLHLAAVDQNDPAMQSMLECVAARKLLCHEQATLNCWRLSLPETWDDYLSILSKSHRKRCRRLVRSYFDSGRVEVHEANEDTFEDVWRVFLNLHALRWGDESRPDGSFSNRRFKAFHEDVSRSLFENDQVRLCYITCDGQPVAAEYQFLDAGNLYAYQSGMAPDSGDVQPGNLSLISTIQYCIERGITSLDLLRGDEPYKAHWRAKPSACHNIRLWPNDLAGTISAKLEVSCLGAKQLAASWLKKD